MIDAALTAIRAVHFAAVLALAGAITFRFAVAGPVLARTRPSDALAVSWRWIVAVAWGVAVVSGCAWLAVLGARIGNTTVLDALTQGVDRTLLTQTQFGTDWLWRAAMAGVLGLMLALGDKCAAGARRACRGAAVMLGIALTGSLAWSGHGAATPGPLGDLHLVADIVHLIASGLWLGGLLPFAIVLMSARRGGVTLHEATEITRRFSRVAAASVAALLMSGIVNGWVLVGSIAGLTESLYGRLLLLKIGLFLVMLAFAACNRFVLTPRLADPTDERTRAASRLAINSCLELGLGLAVLAIVGLLGTLPPAGHHHMMPAQDVSRDDAFVHIHGIAAMADVTIHPGRVGRVDVTIRIMRDDLSELPARAVAVTLVPPSRGASPVSREAVRTSDEQWQVTGVDLREAGNWTAKVVVSRDTAQPAAILDAPVVIEGRR